MGGEGQLLQTGRELLREKPGLSEGDFLHLMLEHFRANDGDLEADADLMPPAGPGGNAWAFVALPILYFRRWRRWRRRLARHRSEMDEAVRVLRLEGHFAARPG